MRREEIRAFIKSGVDALSPSIKFGNGRLSEFSSERNHEYPFVWLETLNRATPAGVFTNSWEVAIHVAQKDKPDSKSDQYEVIIDACDYIAQQLEAQYKFVLRNDKLTIGDISTVPFIHKHADDTTGVIVSFTIEDFSPTPICE